MSEIISRSRARNLARIVVVLIGLALGAIVLSSPLREALHPETLLETLIGLRDSTRTTWYAPLAFIAAFVFGAMFIPTTVFVLTAAFFWGWFLGGVYALIGAVICAILSFELSRYVFGDLTARLFSEKLPKLHRVLDHAGIRSVMLLRLVPGIPFPVFNFGAGLTSLRSRDYLIGSTVGLTIPIFIIAFSADAIFAGTLGRGEVAGRLSIAAVLLAILIIVPHLMMKRMSTSESGDVTTVDRKRNPVDGKLVVRDRP